MPDIKRILIECTETYHADKNTGIQRVVRNVVRDSRAVGAELGVACLPVVYSYGEFVQVSGIPDRSTPTSRLRAAVKDRFTSPHLPLQLGLRVKQVLRQAEKRIRFGDSDLLLLLGSTFQLPIWSAVSRAKDKGAVIGAIVYDMLPITCPEHFHAKLPKPFRFWLSQTLKYADFLIGGSDSVKHELEEYVHTSDDAAMKSRHIDAFRLGSTLDHRKRGGHVRGDVKAAFEGGHTYLTVSTLEPRKNHRYVLDVFDSLWKLYPELRLCFVGKIGWLAIEDLEHIKHHQELDKRFFVFTSLTDTELAYCYENAQALIFPSYAEGFGLPIVEALDHGLRVFASDIPIHHEAGDDFCSYFGLGDRDSLAQLVTSLEDGRPPPVRDISEYQPVAWEDACRELLSKCVALGQGVGHAVSSR